VATASPGGGVVDSLDSPPPAAALVVLSFSSVPSLFSWTPLSSFSFLFFSVLGHRFDVAVHVYGCCGMESKRPLDGFSIWPAVFKIRWLPICIWPAFFLIRWFPIYDDFFVPDK
jgi:hypothetical protein